ncbi:carboxylesterase [Oxalobacteraceae bacterium CAVE-383]|nr:carboxylesterase [Oxalobacteraceae bacterium CAVE-383]
MNNDDLLATTEIETAPNPTASIIWMHGLGADSSDFVPLVPELDLAGCGAIRFVFPDAPVMPVTMNGGYRMRSWYDIIGLGLDRKEDENGLRASQAAIERLIAREQARGVRSERIVIAGFSQGCAMALQIGLRHSQRLAGLLCLSGYLPLRDLVPAERNAINQDIPIFMGHGQFDNVVDPERAEKSRDILQTLGYKVQWRSYPMAHSVCAEEVADISKWLQGVLG